MKNFFRKIKDWSAYRRNSLEYRADFDWTIVIVIFLLSVVGFAIFFFIKLDYIKNGISVEVIDSKNPFSLETASMDRVMKYIGEKEENFK